MFKVFVSLICIGFGLILSGCVTLGNAVSLKPYPLDACIVSDNELGSMGDPVPFAHEGQQNEKPGDDSSAPIEP